MKKQNGINKLAFNKVAVTELNDGQLNDVNGASTPLCLISIISITYYFLD
ncbi:class I lanthipeptide [Flavobacterium sp.]